jgi:hypothetical protein
MSHLIEMATVFGKVIVEHHLKCGAMTLNNDFIADQACDLAYKIYEKVKDYGDTTEEHEKVTLDGIAKLLAKHHVTARTPTQS